MYGEMGCLYNARKIFDGMPMKDVVLWSSIISCYVEYEEASEGLDLFHRMICQGVEADSVTMLSVAEACGDLGFLRLASAEKIFQNVTQRHTASWTAMITCYNQTGCFQEAIGVFLEMQESKVEPNSVTMMVVICSCARLGLLREGKSVHCFVTRKALDADLDFVGPALIELYAECGKLNYCEEVLRVIGERNIVSWNMLISLYARKGLLKQALVAFVQMQTQGLMPDSYGLASSLSACGSVGSIQLGYQIHGHVIKRVDLLSRAGDLSGAYEIIRSMPFHVDASIWSALLNGCRIYRRMDMIKSIESDLVDISTDDTGYYTLLSNIYGEGGDWDEFGKVRSMMKGLTKVPGWSTIELDKRVYRFGAGDTSHLQTNEIYRILDNFPTLALEQGCDEEYR
nr:putative pentatricopeptide repeat-containing protein, mitochondrial [Quercus suber]